MNQMRLRRIRSIGDKRQADCGRGSVLSCLPHFDYEHEHREAEHEHDMLLHARTAAISEAEELTQRKSNPTIECFVCIAWFWLFVVLVLVLVIVLVIA